jgi:hypothetical protein
MRYQLVIEEHPGYVHAKAAGKRTPENVLRFLQDAYAACVKRERASLLLEMKLRLFPDVASAAQWLSFP